MSDNDGDSRMQSSPSSSPDVDSEDVMFPAPSNATTLLTSPTAQTQFASHPASELSPPASQGESFLGGGGGADGPASSSTAPTSPTTTSKGRSRKGEEENVPGAAWNNKRAMEEYARAVEGLVDQKWSLQGFGDPFDESDMAIPK